MSISIFNQPLRHAEGSAANELLPDTAREAMGLGVEARESGCRGVWFTSANPECNIRLAPAASFA
jgi:hypothetical protein